MKEWREYINIEDTREKPKQVLTDFLKPILDTPLTVERIDNYADDVVNELVLLVNHKVDDYKSLHNTGNWDDKAIEDAALKFYGLESISNYLDFLAEKDAEIRGLDQVIKNARQINRVIVPPDIYDHHIGSGNGEEMEEKKMISRVKTILFILKEDFEVDTDNEEQLVLKKGAIRTNMMRKTSYFLISATKINRTLLVCDEEGNASYVLNNEVLKDREISEDILVDSTKEELNELIQETPKLGKRVIYSKTGFVPRIIDAIKYPDSSRLDELTDEMENMGKYLYPKASEDELSCRGLAIRLGVDKDALYKIIKQINPEELGKVERRKFKNNLVDAYSPLQQTLITKTAEQQGLLAPKPKEDESSCFALARKLELGVKTLEQLIKQIDPEELGKVERRKFGGIVTYAYNLKQQELIIKTAEQQGILTPQPKEDELSSSGLAKKLGISKTALKRVIEQINPEKLKEVEQRKFGKNTLTGAYNLDQQRVITEVVEEKGLLAQLPTESELPCSGLADKIGISKKILKVIIEQIDPEKLGEVKQRKFGGNRIAAAYNLDQQRVITEVVEEKGLLTQSSSEGELSCLALALKLRINNTRLNRIIDQIDPQELGEIEQRKFGRNIVKAYSKEQQQIITKYVDKQVKRREQ